ncbi:MAG: thiamine pyrophosphate-dependent enzyme, partial [Candidatus Dormibacteria bacterium]
VGAAPTTRAMQAFVAAAGRLVVVDPDHIELDPTRNAELSLRVDPDVLADALRQAGVPRPGDAWLQSWAGPGAAVRAGVDELLDSGDEPFEGRIARDVATGAGDGATVFAGSSMPVRDLAVYMAPHATLRVLANRGASGIDGSVSSALGIAVVTQPAVALIGDLALLHDASALLWSTRSGARLTVVVIDNDGGGIFNLLPQVSALPHMEFERLFGTPHGPRVDLESFARAAGAGYARVTAAPELHTAMASARSEPGVQLLHVVVDRARSALQRAAVADRVRVVLEAG